MVPMDRISEALQRARQEQGVDRVAFAEGAELAAAAERAPRTAVIKIECTHTPSVETPRDTLAAHRVVSGFPPCMFTDAFKILSTQVSQKLRDNTWSTLAITSPNEHAGKTVIAINL